MREHKKTRQLFFDSKLHCRALVRQIDVRFLRMPRRQTGAILDKDDYPTAVRNRAPLLFRCAHRQRFFCIDQNQLTQHVWNGAKHFQFLLAPCLPFIDLQVLRHAVFWRMGLLRDFVPSLPSDKSRGQHGAKYPVSLIWSSVDGNLINLLHDYLRDTAGQLLDEESNKALEASMPDIEHAVEHYAWTLGRQRN